MAAYEPTPSELPPSLAITNEFARVLVERNEDANGVRLRVQSLRTGQQIFLDALQLESLTWLTDDAFAGLLADPFGPARDEP